LADSRRPPPKGDSPRTTQPRVTQPPRGHQRVIADVEDPTTTHDPSAIPGMIDQTARTPKFLAPEDLRTAIVPQRARTTTPMSTQAQAPTTVMPRVQPPANPSPATPNTMPSAIVERQRVLTPSSGQSIGQSLPRDPNVAPPASQVSGAMTQRSTVSALAQSVGSLSVTDKSMAAVAPAPVEPRTQVWVATHKVPDDPDERLILLREPDSARAASFRVMRHRLQERGDPRIIVVTSARAGEGKTTCAVNLALALGECGRARVLLVEANLRTPSLAPLFGFMPPECFSAQLARHKDKPEDAWSVVEVYSPSLHVLAVKPDHGGGRPLLDGPAFRIAIEMLAQAGYDYIVVDTPPVLGNADVNLVEDSADGVLFVALSATTPARALRQAVEQLQPGKLLGITLLDA
jgi:Mrp family chromosome partitioning ATPase